MRISAAEWALSFGAVLRLTLLISDDKITERARKWIWARTGRPDRGVGYLIICPYCLSLWVGALVLGAAWLLGGYWFLLPAGVLSLSAAAGVVASNT